MGKRKRNKLPPPVHIQPAGSFTCDSCGRRSYFDIQQFDPENLPQEVLLDIAEQAEDFGLDPDHSGVIYSLPTEVYCDNKDCGQAYRPYESEEELDFLNNEDNEAN